MKNHICTVATLLTVGLALTSTPSNAQGYPAHGMPPGIPGGGNGWHRGGGGGAQWSGRVDGTIVVWFQGTKSWVDVKSGDQPRRTNYNFTRPLPAADVNVTVENKSGRGPVFVTQQPTRGNGYIAGVQIEDSQYGRGDYNFTLAWHRNR